MLKKLEEVNINIYLVISIEIIACSISFSANYEGLGMKAVFIKWIPAIIGLLTLFAYFVSKLFIKKYNWLISLLGIILMIAAALTIYQTNFSESF